jgi:glutathione S-transferase
MSEPTELLQFRLSHYNEKARWALDFKRWPHVRETLVPGLHMLRVRRLTGRHKVPVLLLGSRVIAGSNHILEEIERLQPEPRLFPSDPGLRERALTLERTFDQEVAWDLRRLFWACYLESSADSARLATNGFDTRTRLVFQAGFPLMRPLFYRNLRLDAARLRESTERLPRHFDRIASELGPSGYLAGDEFSVADLSVAAIMSAIVRPPEFPYPLPEPRPVRLLELQARVADHPGFRWVESMYRKHRGVSSATSERKRGFSALRAAST